MTRSRRRFLALVGASGLTGAAGCSDPTSDPTPTRGEASTPAPTATPTATARPTATGTETSTPSPTATPEPFQGSPVTRLAAADGDAEDHFGASVAVPASGSVAVVGAPGDDQPNGRDAGSAYVVRRAGGQWTQGAKLWATDGGPGDAFGSDVAAAGDGSTLLVGAPGDEGGPTPVGEGTGAAHVFERDGDDWTEVATLRAAEGDEGDRFGATVALSDDGTTALVGAPRTRGPRGDSVGAAHVFDRIGGDWNQRATLLAAEGAGDDRFGTALALSADGRWALVGAPGDDQPNGDGGGAAYAFRGTGDDWTQVDVLYAPDGDAGDSFGTALGLSGDAIHAVVGAPREEDPNDTDAGAIYAFERDGGWSHSAKLAAENGDSRDRLGSSVSLSRDGRLAVVGAPNDEDPNGQNAGSAYAFRRTNGAWREWRRLVDITGDSVDHFGSAVGVADDRSLAVVGTPNDEDPNGSGAGSAYVFR